MSGLRRRIERLEEESRIGAIPYRGEMGDLYELSDKRPDAVTVVDIYERAGRMFSARERISEGPTDHGTDCPEDSSLPQIKDAVESVRESGCYEYHFIMAIRFPKGVDLDEILARIPRRFGLATVEDFTVEDRPGYFPSLLPK